MRRLLIIRYLFRLGSLALAVIMYFACPQSFEVLNGFGFFHRLSWLHLMWLIWVADMVIQLIPARGYLPLGSLKQFRDFYMPIKTLLDSKELVSLFKKSWLDSLKVLVLWTLLVAGIGLLRAADILQGKELLLFSMVFYVLDLTFVLFWCPFRVWILKNRCCTTCRIFNWDHIMMFSPLLFVPGFYSLSLFGLAVVVFLVWEICFLLYPERFHEETNAALSCSNCTDRLCERKH